MFQNLKDYISQNFSNDCCQNIPLMTQQIKELYPDLNNSKIFDELLILESKEVIKIKQAARKNKCYKEREDWLSIKHKITRYTIKILHHEFFWQPTVSETDWAIKASVDIEKWDFVIQLNGIEEKICVNLKPAKGHQKTLLMKFWEQAQNNVNEWCTYQFGNPCSSINAFFNRFCIMLKPFFIEVTKRGARFTPVVYPQVLKAKNIQELVFFEGKSNELRYKCKFDEKGQFIRWIKL